MSYSLDDFADADQARYARSPKPIWALGVDDPKNEKQVLAWLNGELAYLQNKDESRIRQIHKNMARYKGVQYESQETRQSLRDKEGDRARAVKKIVANHLYDLTEQRVSKEIKYKPGVAIMPTNDEFEDKIAAKAVKALLDNIWYNENFEGEVTPSISKRSKIAGEDFLFITWDPDKGDEHPDWKKAKAEAKQKGLTPRVPLLDDNGQPQKDESGNPIFIEKPIRVGDVQYDVELATHVYLQRKPRWEQVDYLFRRRVLPTEELKVKYPKLASQIRVSQDAQVYDFESLELRKTENETVYYEFWHRRTRPMDSGRFIVFTPDVILENTEFPFSHRELPCKRLTDIDIPGELHGMSFFQIAGPLTGTYNNLTNMIIRNQTLVAHPKWMMPKGAAKIETLGNDITIVQYQGPTAPQLIQANPTPNEVFEFRDKLKEEFGQLSGIYGTSRGEPPPGIKAGIALQFLNEQEQERHNLSILKWNEWIRQVAVMTIAVAGDYYDSTDERMIRVLGKNNKWMSVYFDAAHLSKSYDIRVQNASALPQSKAARLQTLLDLNQQFPNQVTPEQVLDMIDLAQDQKFLDTATVSVRAAEAENEEMSEGHEIPPPAEFENHILHWKTHTRLVQEYAFKMQTPKEVQDLVLDHIMATEMLMVEQGKKNPTFAQELTALPMFPMFYQDQPNPEDAVVLPAPPAAPQPQAGGALPTEAAPPAGPFPPEQGLESAEAMPAIAEQIGEPEVPGTGPIEPTGVV